MNEELDSQLSAMFDDQLASAECELLARRLSRDEQLKARWGRYAAIGAAIRAEHGVRLDAALAGRVNAAILAEPELGAVPAIARTRSRGLNWWQGAAGVAVAAGVAAVSIFWLRGQAPLAPGALTAQVAPTAQSAPAVPPGTPVAGTAAVAVLNRAPAADTYVTPSSPAVRPVMVPTTELANYVVAHSMVSSPVARRNLLSAFMTSEPGAAGTDEPLEDPKSKAQ